MEDFKLLISLIKDYWSQKYRKIPYSSLAVILFTIFYLINPFDLIPDYILGIGQIDDAAILKRIRQGLELRDGLKSKVTKIYESHDAVTWTPKSEEEIYKKAETVGVLQTENEEIEKMQEQQQNKNNFRPR